MTVGQRSFLYHAITWVFLVGSLTGLYFNSQPPEKFHKSNTVYFSCPSDDYRSYEVVRSSEGRITAIYDREYKKLLTGREYVEKTTNCIVAKVAEADLDREGQNFFEIITFRSDNEELY